MTDDVYTRVVEALYDDRHACADGRIMKAVLTRANLAIVDAGELVRMREALQCFADKVEPMSKWPGSPYAACPISADDCRRARAALSTEEKQG